MTTTYHRNADGARVADQDAIDERGCLRDGFSIRSRAVLMDAGWDAARTVHAIIDTFAPLTDQQKSDRIERYNARISDAWRTPAMSPHLPATSTATTDHDPKMVDVYDRHDRRLENAWRTA